MTAAVKRTISLPADLAEEVEEIASQEGKSVSAVIQEALRLARTERLKRQFKDSQGYWSQKARDRGVLTEKQLERLLSE